MTTMDDVGGPVATIGGQAIHTHDHQWVLYRARFQRDELMGDGVGAGHECRDGEPRAL
jgi:hypothetical protein